MEQDLARLAGGLGVAAGEYDVGALLDELPRVLLAPPSAMPHHSPLAATTSPPASRRPALPQPASQPASQAARRGRQPGKALARRTPPRRTRPCACPCQPHDDQGKGV